MGYVVAVAGAAGAGKSALVRGLVDALGDAVAIYIDDYQQITEQPIQAITRWMERGADFDEFAIPLVGEHLARLKRGDPVVHPRTLREIRPRKYIVFETLFGRAHTASGQHIDCLVWVDTPLDVALARRLRDVARALMDETGSSPNDALARMRNYITHYLDDVRPLLLMQAARIGADADITVDGTDDLGRIVERVRQDLVARVG